MHDIRVFLIRSYINSSVRMSRVDLLIRMLFFVLLFLLSSIRGLRVDVMIFL